MKFPPLLFLLIGPVCASSLWILGQSRRGLWAGFFCVCDWELNFTSPTNTSVRLFTIPSACFNSFQPLGNASVVFYLFSIILMALETKALMLCSMFSLDRLCIKSLDFSLSSLSSTQLLLSGTQVQRKIFSFHMNLVLLKNTGLAIYRAVTSIHRMRT